MRKRGLKPTIFLPKNRKGQMKMSFGMIFSIFLIIIFLAAAFYAITKFIDMQRTVQIKLFMDNLQADVNQMWQSQQGSREVEYYLPKKINAVCFVQDDYQNLMFDSKKPVDGGDIEHIKIESITAEGDYCIDNINGKVSMTLVKEYGESLVIIARS